MIIKINGFQLATDYSSAYKSNIAIDFTAQEQRALRTFLDDASSNTSNSKIIPSAQLNKAIWGNKVVTEHSLRKLLSELRKKFDDKNAIVNVRGEGYRLCFTSENRKQIHIINNKKVFIFVCCIFVLAALTFSLVNHHADTDHSRHLNTQRLFDVDMYIEDFSVFENTLYASLSDENVSKVVKIQNGIEEILFSPSYYSFRNFSIHSSGRTVIHTLQNEKCVIRVFNSPFTEELEPLPCLRSNSFIGFDWISKDKLLLSYNFKNSENVIPYIYDVQTKTISPLEDIDFNTTKEFKTWDYFLKKTAKGTLSLRADEFHTVQLVYFEGNHYKELFTFKGKPTSIGVMGYSVYLINAKNQLVKLEYENGFLEKETSYSVLSSSNLTPIKDLKIINNDLYFLDTNKGSFQLDSTNDSFNRVSASEIIDFVAHQNLLITLGSENDGFSIETYNGSLLIDKKYIETNYNLTQIGVIDGNLLVGGTNGLFHFDGNSLKQISEQEIGEIASGKNCAAFETFDGIFSINSSFKTKAINVNGRSLFPYNQDCLYVDKVDGFIKSLDGKAIIHSKGKKRLLSYKGEITYWANVRAETLINNLKNDEVLGRIKKRVRNKRLVSLNDELYYLRAPELHSTLYKITNYKLKL